MSLATILIEDSLAIRKSLIPALAEVAGVEVIATAETAEQAIAALKSHADAWRLAVVDVSLKVGNGLHVLRAGRERRRDQHMVVLTNYATPDIRRKSIEYGAEAVFDKSTEIDRFFELCRQYSDEATPRLAQAPGAVSPLLKDETMPDSRHASGVEELIERVSVNRLLTEAVSESVGKNAAAVRDHLKRQGQARQKSSESAAELQQPTPDDGKLDDRS